MKTIKTKLRAWLIDLVREAIRIERAAVQPMPVKSAPPRSPLNMQAVGSVAREAIGPMLEVSFEQMQSESIAAQVKHYEVAQ